MKRQKPSERRDGLLWYIRSQDGETLVKLVPIKVSCKGTRFHSPELHYHLFNGIHKSRLGNFNEFKGDSGEFQTLVKAGCLEEAVKLFEYRYRKARRSWIHRFFQYVWRTVYSHYLKEVASPKFREFTRKFVVKHFEYNHGIIKMTFGLAGYADFHWQTYKFLTEQEQKTFVGLWFDSNSKVTGIKI